MSSKPMPLGRVKRLTRWRRRGGDVDQVEAADQLFGLGEGLSVRRAALGTAMYGAPGMRPSEAMSTPAWASPSKRI